MAVVVAAQAAAKKRLRAARTLCGQLLLAEGILKESLEEFQLVGHDARRLLQSIPIVRAEMASTCR